MDRKYGRQVVCTRNRRVGSEQIKGKERTGENSGKVDNTSQIKLDSLVKNASPQVVASKHIY